MAKFKINDIFASVQGEGLDVGMPCVFVRFAGCNLRCAWCDTEFDTVNYEMTSNELIEYICQEFSGETYIILTGGEPLIQNRDELESLCISLRGAGYRVAVETNGTIAPQSFIVPKLMFDLMAISPKLGSAKNKIGLDKTYAAQWSGVCPVQLKFVIADEEDMVQALNYISDYEFAPNMVVVFQPEASTGAEGYHKMMGYFHNQTGGADIGHQVRFLPQVHKMIDIK